MRMKIVRCLSCDGFGWTQDDLSDEHEDCEWCGGIGYTYRNANQVDQIIPQADLHLPDVSQELEALETERMREMGYQGTARRPWDQAIRRGTTGGVNPYEEESD